MKFSIELKAPDSIHEGLRDAVLNYSNDPEDRNVLEGQLREFLQQWISGSEYVMLEFDTDENTAIVVKDDA